jgi:hypothetical protein
MRAPRITAALVGGLLLAATGLAVGPGAASAVPVPEQDAFYRVPADVAAHSSGDILNSRSVSVSAYGLPLPVRAWQLQYRSLDSENRPTADVTTILVPVLPWLGRGARPLVSYQTAEDGVAGKCAPSYALRAGLAGGVSNSEAETGLMLLALLRGWAVAVPDYEGPDSAFLGGPGEAHGVLDGLRAALHFTPAGLGAAGPVGLWGYSGGSLASADAAQLQPSYAPELHLAGVATGGLVADIDATIYAFSGSVLGGAIPMGVNGMLRAFPAAHLEQYLSAKGRAEVAATAGDCINDAALRYPLTRVADLEAYPGALAQPAVQDLLRASSPDGIGGVPTAPVYDYHAIFDEFAPIGPDRALMRGYCAAGVVVQHVEDLVAEHISETVTGAPGALTFLADRFAGRTPKNTCASIPTA